MSGLVIDISPINRVGQKYRKYWKLEEMLPKDEGLPVKVRFDIKHHAFLAHCSGFVDMAHYSNIGVLRSSEWFEIQVIDILRANDFDVRVGIARKSGKEVVVSNAEVISRRNNAVVIQLIRRSELRKMMHSFKELEFFVATDKKEEEKEEESKLDMQKFRTDYKELLLSGRNSDFTINVKDRKFEVHMSILGARSPLFLVMMEHEIKENLSREVNIIDADPAIFREFLLYLYTGDEEHLDWKNVVELYTLGDKYCLEDLQYLCVERMKAHISIVNFFQVFYISQRLNHSELSEIAIQFFLEDSNEIIKSEKYIEFKKEHPEETNILLKALQAD